MNLSKPKINALLALALFTFVFLAAEFRFDINVGLLTGAERVVLAQGFILGASVIGFIGYAPLLGLAQRKGRPQAVVSAAVPIAILGLTQIQSPRARLRSRFWDASHSSDSAYWAARHTMPSQRHSKTIPSSPPVREQPMPRAS